MQIKIDFKSLADLIESKSNSGNDVIQSFCFYLVSSTKLYSRFSRPGLSGGLLDYCKDTICGGHFIVRPRLARVSNAKIFKPTPTKFPCAETCEISTSTMPAPSNTLLIEGSFDELADELAHYIDDVRKKPGDESTGIKAEIAPLLEQGQKDEALKKLVTGSIALNSAPEKGKEKRSIWQPVGGTDINGLNSRIYRRLQPPCSSHSSVAQCRQISAQNMSESVSTHHFLSSQWFGPCPFDSHHDL